MIIGYKDAIDKNFIKLLSNSILLSTRNQKEDNRIPDCTFNKKFIKWLSIPYCAYEYLRKKIIGYKDAFDKKFIKRLSNSILLSTRNQKEDNRIPDCTFNCGLVDPVVDPSKKGKWSPGFEPPDHQSRTLDCSTSSATYKVINTYI